MNKYIKIIQSEGHKCDDCGCDEKAYIVKIKNDTQTYKGYMCLKCIAEMFKQIYEEEINDGKES